MAVNGLTAIQGSAALQCIHPLTLTLLGLLQPYLMPSVRATKYRTLLLTCWPKEC